MANPQENALHYPHGDTLPERGSALEIAPGVLWLRMALPFALDHINLWLLRDVQGGTPGWTIVDCGIADDATRAAWQQVFDSVLQGLPVLRVIATHMHPDHLGLAAWLTERWTTPERECRLWISATDWNAARVATLPDSGFGGAPAARFFAQHGVTDAAVLARVAARGNEYAGMVPAVPRRYRRLMDGMLLTIGGRQWRCIAGYGHAPEHIALHCAERVAAGAGVLIAGDMVLPRISTNVSVIDIEPEANPLPLYLDSIARLRALPADTLVLPSHGRPFTGLHARVDQLHAHHAERFADVLQACTEPRSAADMLPVLFRRALDAQQTPFAMGEAIAHLHALQADGRLRSVPGSDGVLRFLRS